MQSNRINNSLRNVLFGLLKYTVSIAFPFITRTILIYKLGTEYAGISSLFSSILQVLNLSELGFSTAVVFALYEPVAKNESEKICALLRFFRSVYKYCGLFILIAGLCVCPFIKHLISGTYPTEINIYIVFILLLINTAISYLFCGYKSVLFAANQRDDILSKAQIVSNLIMYIAQIVILTIFTNYYAYISLLIIGTLTNNALLYYFSKRMFPDIVCKGVIESGEKNKLVHSIKSLFGHQLDMVIITSADNIVISMFLGLNTLTIYNNYYYIISSLLSILIMVSNSFTGSIGNSIAIESKEKNFKNFIDFTYFIGLISCFCAIMMFVLFQDFMTLWMGQNRLLSLDIILLLCCSFYVRQFRRSVITYKIAAGVWNLDALKPYVAAAVNLILNIITVRVIGLYGVIISTIISMILIEAPWEIYVLFKKYFNTGLKIYLEVQANIVMKTVLCGVALYYISGIFLVKNITSFFIKAIILGIILSGILLLLSFRDKQFVYLLKTFKSVLLKRKRSRQNI